MWQNCLGWLLMPKVSANSATLLSISAGRYLQSCLLVWLAGSNLLRLDPRQGPCRCTVPAGDFVKATIFWKVGDQKDWGKMILRMKSVLENLAFHISVGSPSPGPVWWNHTDEGFPFEVCLTPGAWRCWPLISVCHLRAPNCLAVLIFQLCSVVCASFSKNSSSLVATLWTGGYFHLKRRVCRDRGRGRWDWNHTEAICPLPGWTGCNRKISRWTTVHKGIYRSLYHSPPWPFHLSHSVMFSPPKYLPDQG